MFTLFISQLLQAALTILDCFSRYLFAFPVVKECAENVVKWCIDTFEKCGYPETWQSDNGKPFLSKVVKRLERESPLLAARHGHPYNPNHQARVERVHGTLKPRLRELMESLGRTYSKDPWSDLLEMVVNSYNNTPNVSKYVLKSHNLSFVECPHPLSSCDIPTQPGLPQTISSLS